MTRVRFFAVAVAAALLLAGCSGAPGSATALQAAAVVTHGCGAAGSGVPAGAHARSTVDVDGDGRADTQWITSDRFGITTASGDTTSVPVDVAGSAAPAGLVARVGGGPVLAFVAGARDVQLFRFTGCALHAVGNPTGGQWRFDLTGRHGTGVGCQDADGDGRVDLNGLRVQQPIDSVPAGTYVRVTRTIIRISGLHASAGPSDVVEARAGSSALAAATTVTCGSLTIDGNGVSAAPTGASRSGCPANDVAIPAGAMVRTIADVDGDGRADREFFAETSKGLYYGIRTASGRTVLLRDGLAGPATHEGWTARFAASPPLTVIDDGRTATLQTFVGCRFTTTTDVVNRPWTFGLDGFSPYGTGVECSVGQDGARLEGVLATRLADGRYRLTTTAIDVSRNGLVASAGGSRSTTAAAGSAAVRLAQRSTCGATPIVHAGGR